MNIRLLVSFALFFICSFGFSDEITLGFINAKLDSHEVAKLAGLSREELLETLTKDFDVEVVVMPFDAGYLVDGSPIQVLQTEEHKNAAKVFLNMEKLSLKDVNATVMFPFRMALSPVGEQIDRPFADKHVLITSRNAGRAVIFHEALHLLIDLKRDRKREHGKYQGREVHALDMAQVERVKLRLPYENNPKSLTNSQLIRMAELEMLLLERSHAEELALFTFEVENKDKLKLPGDFIKNELGSFRIVINLIAEMLTFSYRAVRPITDANEQEKKRINALMAKFEWWQNKGLPTANAWIEKHDPKKPNLSPLLPGLDP